MDSQKYRLAIANTINNLINNKPTKSEPEHLDMGGFLVACKKEFISLSIPIYDMRVSQYRDNVIIVELPFCQSCEIAINVPEFGRDDREVVLYVDKKPVRKINIKTYDAKYMNKVAMAVVDYFKRYMMLKNRFESE